MDNNIRLSLKNEIEKEATTIEEELRINPDLNCINATSEMDIVLSEKISEYKSHKNHKAT